MVSSVAMWPGCSTSLLSLSPLSCSCCLTVWQHLYTFHHQTLTRSSLSEWVQLLLLLGCHSSSFKCWDASNFIAATAQHFHHFHLSTNIWKWSVRLSLTCHLLGSAMSQWVWLYLAGSLAVRWACNSQESGNILFVLTDPYTSCKSATSQQDLYQERNFLMRNLHNL